jgi:hypothetical protein
MQHSSMILLLHRHHPAHFQSYGTMKSLNSFFWHRPQIIHYIELEFSPRGHYLVLLLIEQRKVLKEMLPLPDYHVERPSSNRWIGRVHVPRAHFPARVDRFNAYAIHGQGNNRTYEALYPAPPGSDKPDFHRLELFQPLNFELFLNQTERDGESWNNHASHSTSFSVSLLLILLLALCS